MKKEILIWQAIIFILGFFLIFTIRTYLQDKIEVEAEDKKALLFDFLSKFLYYQDAESIMFHDIKVEKIEQKDGKWSISAIAKGEEFDPKKHDQGTHVKAITYRNMEIEESKDKYRIKYLVDI